MKVLDVNKFQQGIEGNINRLTRLENEMKQIETTIQGLIQLEESLKGQGGEALRNYYENCHIPFLEFFQTFKSSFTTILQTMDSTLTSLEPDSTGYIRQEFLEGEIEQGLDVASQVTEELTNETNEIMSTVSDIVSLPNLDDSEVQVGVLDAKSHRDQTVEQLNVFDFTQTMALTAIQSDLLLMQTWITNIESMMMEGLTDVNFPSEQWKAFASQNPLMTTLAARALSLDNVINMNPLLAPSFVSGANPYTLSSLQLYNQNPLFNFGISGATTSTNFVAFMDKQREEIAKELSCPAPDVDDVKEEEDPILAFLGYVGNGTVALGQGVADAVVKSANSFNEIGGDIWSGLGTLNDKKFDSHFDFWNYATVGSLGALTSTYQAMDERADVAFESPSNFANYLTMGSVDLVKGALNPEESFSKEHWLNSIGVVTSVAGGANLVVGNVSKQVVKNGSTKQPSSVDEVVNMGTGKGKTNVYSVKDFLNEMNNLPHVNLSKEVTDGIISTPKGNRPLPQVYMTKKEISSHLALFDEGAVKIQSRESYEQVTKLYGSNIGDPKTGTYVLPKNVVDKAVEASNGNPRVLEELLGLEKGYLGEKPIMIKISEIENIRVPSGNEAGAWQGFWEPGGYTQGGIPEAVVDQIKSSNYTVSDIY